jgi:crotonobetainyl-CoA:carnitine CoA-transferase CaiB-like acyl-CoA transferase
MTAGSSGRDGPGGPLSGIRVIDVSSYVAGPFAGVMLADLGAEVIKVEPERGDPTRRIGGAPGQTSPLAATVNRNKRSVGLTLSEPAGRSALLGLARDADVFLHNWRPSTQARLGLTDDVLEAAQPRLIRVAISGYGQDSVHAEEPAFDPIIQAQCALFSPAGDNGRPTAVNMIIADKIASLFTVQAVLAALHARERTGLGDRVTVPMLDSLAYFDFPDLLEGETFIDEPGTGRRAGAYTAARALDGYLVLAPTTGAQIKRTLEVVGHPEWRDQLARHSDRTEFMGGLTDLIEPVLQTASVGEWLDRFGQADVPAAPVVDIAGHLQDPHVLHNRVYQEYSHPERGRVRVARYPIRFAGSAPVAAGPYPEPGQDNAELLGPGFAIRNESESAHRSSDGAEGTSVAPFPDALGQHD